MRDRALAGNIGWQTQGRANETHLAFDTLPRSGSMSQGLELARTDVRFDD